MGKVLGCRSLDAKVVLGQNGPDGAKCACGGERMRVAGFEDKLLARLGRLDPDQVQKYVSRLLGERQLLLRVVDHLDEGLIVANSALRPILMNRRATVMLGLPRWRKGSDKNLVELLPASHPLRDTIVSLRRHARVIENYECPYGPSQERVLSLSTLPIRSPLEGVATEGLLEVEPGEELLIVLLRDVTERHRRMEEQGRARRLASMATLTAGIAHEVKNPLNAINIHAQLLKGELGRGRDRGADPARIERATDVILEETGRLARIVEGFLQAARPQSPRLEPCPLRPILEGLEGVFQAECRQHGIVFKCSVDPEIPPMMIDQHLIRQALGNLLRNAIEALAERSEQARNRSEGFVPRLELRAELAGPLVHLTVEDNGAGIADEHLEHIFEPYYTTKFTGTGLGLMVVYRIVTEHRGEVHVDTHPGEGTRFVIKLPLHQRPVRLLESQRPEPSPSRPGNSDPKA